MVFRILGIIALFVVGFGLILASFLLSGWIFSLIWNLVIPAIWVSAPHLTAVQGAGILCLVGMLTGGSRVRTIVHKS